MKFNRRRFLQGLGAVSVLVVGGGVYRAVDRGVFAAGTGPAYVAWDDWRTAPVAGALRLVQSAILAANPHNTQPWLFQVTDDQVELYADTSRHLATMDPYLREMHIGLGCAIENMLQTAAATGYAVELTLAAGELTPPNATPGVESVATLRLTPAEAQPSSLYTAIPQRRTNRYNYDPVRPIDATQLAEFTALADDETVQILTFAQETPAFATLAAATIASTEAIIADAAMAYDSFRWINPSWQAVQQNKAGLFIDTAGTPSYIRAPVKMLPGISQQQIDAGWLSNTQATLANSALLGLLTVRNLYDTTTALQAGRLWQRLHLWATTAGLAMQPINQLPEVVDRDRQLGQPSRMAAVIAELTGDPAWQPTFAFRMGHPLNTPLPSARRPVAEVLL
jgi:hypothetical protein